MDNCKVGGGFVNIFSDKSLKIANIASDIREMIDSTG